MWTAITLWSLNVTVLAAWIAFAWHASRNSGGAMLAWIVALPLAYAAFVLAITLFEFAVSWIWRAPRAPAQQIGVAQTLRMIWNEYVTLLGSAFRMMAYRWGARDPSPAAAATPVVLVHGVLCNAGVWIPMLRKFRAMGIGPAYTVSYGPPLDAIEEFAAQLDQHIQSALAATGAARAVIVAHSMGGLVARAYLRDYGGSRVARVVTIGTPHHGSALAYWFPGVCIAQMRPGSAWLAALPAPTEVLPIVSLWSPHDSMVVPQTSCVLDGATNVAFVGVGHNALLRDEAVHARVVDEIRVAQETRQ
jgi:triacylglycerol esterase/lipase EstA (alpha/beta hydrolase family)